MSATDIMSMATAEAIAREHLGIETLCERKSDSLDFHDCGVVSIHDALAAAYEAGRASGAAGAGDALRALLRDCVNENGSRRAPSKTGVENAQRAVRNLI